MKILLTGASSFTGYWFALKLAERGHEVWVTFTRESAEAYGSDVRGQRVKRVVPKCRPVYSCRFGDAKFLEALSGQKIELLCHHAADVTDYRRPEFDISRAVASNTFGARDVLRSLGAQDGALVLTGTVFEPGEGAGSDGLPALSPYGLSKRLTDEIFRFQCKSLGARMGKFVIPNPFGPWEDARFTTYLARTWNVGEVATIRTPDYIRDNIHVSLLSAAYVAFVERVAKEKEFVRVNPSGYVESQGAFTERVAREIRSRTPWKCQVECAKQTTFDEPMERFNTEPVDGRKLGWSESAAWDELAEYYERMFARD
jgi:UDP-glucose 4-epimerase